MINQYDSISEKEIREMSRKELEDAVIRLLSVKEVEAATINGMVLLPDELADAFRNRK